VVSGTHKSGWGRLLEKIHSGMVAKAGELSGIKKLLYLWAIKVANKPNAGKYWAYGLLDKLIYSKWREALGNNIVGIVTGAAALQPRLDTFFNNIGIRVREAYGMTEASPGVSANLFEKNMSKNGTVGPILKNVEVKLDHREGMEAGEGEILVRGENIMMGYYKNHEATNSTIKDGWLYTGDVGKFVDDTFLKITDRIKELFKTSGGKYVAPQYLENKLKESKYIEQVIVVGNERKFVAAIIYPNIANLKSWADYKKLKIDFTTDEWLTNEWILIKIKKVIDQYNEQFSQIEKVKQFRLINTEWTIDGGHLTPTLKLKRKAIETNHASLIEDIYKD
ncbi:MAG: AMP-dependent synthetase/ligase, partial [Chitinophagales bacterium]